jgi:hypothetical protein
MMALLQRHPRSAFLFLLTLTAISCVLSGAAFLSRKGIISFGRETEVLEHIRHESGLGYIAPTHHPELSAERHPSSAMLLENGVPLSGAAGAAHEDIRELGAGRTSFWKGDVYFATSDNSSPATNGRSYAIRYPRALTSPQAFGFYALTTLLLVLTIRLARKTAESRAAIRHDRPSPETLPTHSPPPPSVVFPPISRPLQLASIAFIAIWPFAFLFAYTFNIIGVGNDFSQLYYDYKVYFLSMLKSGVFPLWSPTEGCGYPFFSSPFAQPFYPLNVLYYLYFRVFGHFSNWDYELFTILAFSIFGVGLFLWLRRLRVSPGSALAATICAEMSLKVTELLRLPNAAHCAAWYPWLLLGITMAAESGGGLLGSLVLGGALLMILTAGYPYFIIYAGLLLISYALAMFANSARNAFYHGTPVPFCGKSRFFWRVASPSVLSLLIASPILLNAKVLLSQTVDRSSPDLDFATQNSFTLTETVGGWLFPPVSSMEGWYYFGILCVLLLGCHCVSSMFALKGHREDRGLVYMILFWSAAVLYFTLGRQSLLFTFVWHHSALLSQMRCWARLTIVLVPPVALLLARALEHFSGAPGIPQPFAVRPTFSILAVVAVATAGLQFYFLRQNHFDYYWSHFFKDYPGYIYDSPTVRTRFPFYLNHGFDEWRFFRVTVCAAAFLAAFLLWRISGRAKKLLAGAFLAAFVAFNAAELRILSPYQWADLPAIELRGRHFDALSLLNAGFSVPRNLSGVGIANESRATYSIAPFENWDFARHVRIYLGYLDYNKAQWRAGVPAAEQANVMQFYGADAGAKRIFFSSSVDQKTIPGFMDDANRFAQEWKPSFRVIAYDGDSLRLEVTMPHPGWLSFVDNWDPYWTASIDRKDSPISRLLGSYKSVFVPSGRAEVEFAYRPAFWPKAIRP